ncbi:MAG: DUF992 domain-containing protein [Hyphomicrobiales bacterium]|nr:DUF992 domain-containing protein [Hyphomicrobiales bacterium]
MIGTLKKPAIAAALALACLQPAISEARNDAKVKIGILRCVVSEGTGFIFGSSKDLDCTFDAANGDTERYYGQINKFGVDIGFTNKASLSWAVLAPTRDFSDGALAGRYLGASAEATAGVGAGANILVGGSRDTFSLQPLSVQGQTGLNAAVGVSELILDQI